MATDPDTDKTRIIIGQGSKGDHNAIPLCKDQRGNFTPWRLKIAHFSFVGVVLLDSLGQGSDGAGSVKGRAWREDDHSSEHARRMVRLIFL